MYAADPVKGRSRLIWQQSRYLPRESSRLLLLVQSTRPQRLQDISEADARAVGYDASRESLPPIEWFALLWDRLSVTESLRWDANPWLWVVHFEVMLPKPQSTPTQEQALIAPPSESKPPPENARARSPRTATMEERHRLAEMLRSRSK